MRPDLPYSGSARLLKSLANTKTTATLFGNIHINNLETLLFSSLLVLLMPNGMIVGGKIFKTDGSKGDYETAIIFCSQMGAMIASPRNAAENKAVQQIAQWQNTKILLGFTDIETEGKFLDANGTMMAYSNWAPGEPNNLGNEDCIEMHPDGKWHDRNCRLAWLLVCQFKTIED